MYKYPRKWIPAHRSLTVGIDTSQNIVVKLKYADLIQVKSNYSRYTKWE